MKTTYTRNLQNYLNSNTLNINTARAKGSAQCDCGESSAIFIFDDKGNKSEKIIECVACYVSENGLKLEVGQELTINEMYDYFEIPATTKPHIEIFYDNFDFEEGAYIHNIKFHKIWEDFQNHLNDVIRVIDIDIF